jgi:ankyrin repeat protein
MPEQADIHMLVRENALDKVEHLLYMQPNTLNKARIRDGATALHLSVDKNSLEMTTMLLSHRPDLLIGNKLTAWNCMHIAANRGLNDMIDLLVNAAEEQVPKLIPPKAPALPEKKGANKEYELERINQQSVAQALIDKETLDEYEKLKFEAKMKILTAKDKDGMTPTLVACVAGHVHTVELLVDKYKVLPNALNNMGDGPLHISSYWNRIDLVEYLLGLSPAFCVDVKKQNIHGNTPLHRACQKGNAEIANMLALHGANMLAINYEGLTPMDVSHPDIVKKLR